jgi:hypothetical protein
MIYILHEIYMPYIDYWHTCTTLVSTYVDGRCVHFLGPSNQLVVTCLNPINNDSKCAYNEYIIVKNVYTYCPCLLNNLPILGDYI